MTSRDSKTIVRQQPTSMRVGGEGRILPQVRVGRNLSTKIARYYEGAMVALGTIGRLRSFKFRGYLLSYFLLVVVPSISSIVYLAFVAADQYVAEARFAVRSIESVGGAEKLLSALAVSGAGAAPAMGSQDPYIVTSYIHSRAIVEDLSGIVDLRAIFSRPEADFWARLESDASIEDLVKYWNGMIGTYVDGPSGIVTVTVRAFRSEDALTLAKSIIAASEKLVNEVSARARADAMRAAEDEVRRYERQVREALVELRKFRDSQGFIDPVSSAASTSSLLLQVMGERIKLQSEIFVASRIMSVSAPAVQTLRTRIEGIDRQIEELKSKLAGESNDGQTISKSLVRYEELELNRIFSEKLYNMAQDALERARLRAERQNVYVSVFVSPSLPEEAVLPKRLALSFIIPIALLIVWGIVALVGAAVEDHRI